MSTDLPPYLESSSQNYLIVGTEKCRKEAKIAKDNRGMFWIVELSDLLVGGA